MAFQDHHPGSSFEPLVEYEWPGGEVHFFRLLRGYQSVKPVPPERGPV